MDKVLQDEQAKRVKQISHTIRQTIRDTLPGPADQFLTLMIPGKVVDFEVSGLEKKRIRPLMTVVP
jgi:hypothetical protein